MRASLLVVFVSILMIPVVGLAQQQEVCGLRAITETASLVYPPIARAAHVEGNVIMLVSFKMSGEVEDVHVLSGPKLLEVAATSYVKKLRANEYTGPRTCPMVVKFQILRPEDKTEPSVTRRDLQHVIITTYVLVLDSMPSSMASAR